MISIQNSIQTKLTASYILLIFFISMGVFLFTFGSAKQALKDLTRSELKEIILVAQSQINQEEIENILGLREGDEGSPKHVELIRRFVGMRSGSEDVTNYYVIKKDGETMKLIFDDVYPDGYYASINEIYGEPDQVLVDNWGKVSVSKEFYTDKWGTFLSAYAPLKDEKGNVVAMLGVDMKADKVIAKQNFIGSTVYFIIGLSILITALIILFFSKTIIRDLKELSMEAERISSGDMNLEVTIRRKDEIGELAVTFNRMAENVKKSQTILEEKVKERTAELEKAKAGLEEVVNVRTAELQKNLAEMKKMNEFMVGREVRMVELKKKITELGGEA